jgi:triacylglycerol lipase
MQKIVTGIVGAVLASVAAQAQVPKEIHAELVKIGQIVAPACTAKLYRPLMPKADFNTYWPHDAAAPVSTAPLYPGITISRDQLFGPNEKDVVDVFTAERGGGNRPIFIFVPGGGGNKVEQQVREGNAFYDNIGRWAAKNGMVGVTVQRHPGQNWDDGGRDLSMAVDWVKDNAPKFRGDPNRIFIAAHSAGTVPLGVYVGHPARWKNGVQVKGAIYMSGNPVPSLGGGRGQGRGGPGGAELPAPGSTCGTSANMGSNDGMIAGPSGQRAAAGAPAAGARPGGPGGPGRGGPQLTPEQQAERDNLPGFKATPVKIMLVRAELDPGVMGDMLVSDKAVHDELCKLDGEQAKDGEGRCPAMLFAKSHSHMSEVFAFDTPDKSVSDPILAWMKKIK